MTRGQVMGVLLGIHLSSPTACQGFCGLQGGRVCFLCQFQALLSEVPLYSAVGHMAPGIAHSTATLPICFPC